MNIFVFDNTFEGLLTSVFEAYSRRVFPDALSPEGEPLPLFYDEVFTVITEEEKAKRVWRGSAKETLFRCSVLPRPMLAGGGTGNSDAFVSLYS